MNPMVSICCLAYNQKKYIKKTIDSFLSQKTSFDFEIIIHDDASSDGTQPSFRQWMCIDGDTAGALSVIKERCGTDCL